MATVMINSNNEKALFLSLYWALKTSFLTQIHADITQIHADFSDETICDHLRLICENLRLEDFFRGLL